MKSILIKLKGHPHVQKGTAYTILFAMGFCHLLNDMIQSVIPAMYPVLKDNFGFTFAQIGIITLVFQLTSSVGSTTVIPPTPMTRITPNHTGSTRTTT